MWLLKSANPLASRSRQATKLVQLRNAKPHGSP